MIVFSNYGAEGVLVIPSAPCTFCDGGGAQFQAIQNFQSGNVYQYPLTDFAGLGGNILVTSEFGGGTALVTWDGANYNTVFFDDIPGGEFEGASFADCDIPPASPTPTPTATPTAARRSQRLLQHLQLQPRLPTTAESHPYSDRQHYAYSHRYGHCNSHLYSNAYRNSHVHTDANSYGNGDCNRYLLLQLPPRQLHSPRHQQQPLRPLQPLPILQLLLQQPRSHRPRPRGESNAHSYGNGDCNGYLYSNSYRNSHVPHRRQRLRPRRLPQLPTLQLLPPQQRSPRYQQLRQHLRLTPTATFTPTPTATYTPTPTPTPTACAGLTISQIGDTIVPGDTDTGNHGEDLVTNVALPFPYMACGTAHTSINVSVNGNAQFTTSDVDYLSNTCLPWSGHDCTIFPYWDDLRTDDNSGCTGYPGDTCGIYTSVSGTAPNRIFNIEWRAVYMDDPDQKANFELRLYEGQNRFDVIYGTLEEGNSGATAGVQSCDTCFAEYLLQRLRWIAYRRLDFNRPRKRM